MAAASALPAGLPPLYPHGRLRWRSSSTLTSGTHYLGRIDEGRLLAGRGSIDTNINNVLAQPFYLPSKASATSLSSRSMASSRSSISNNSVTLRMSNGYDKRLQQRYSIDELSLQSDASTIKAQPVANGNHASASATLGRNARVCSNTSSHSTPAGDRRSDTLGRTLSAQTGLSAQSASTYLAGVHLNGGALPYSGYSATGTLKKMSSTGSEMSLRRRKKRTGENVLPDREINQVGLMYQSQSTKVFVCRCLANLYVSNSDSLKSKAPQWDLRFTGIPLMLLDLGLSRSRTNRQLQLVLAERGTGFAMWRDSLDALSKVTEVDKTFHTLLHSKDHGTVIGLSYDNAFAAGEIYQKIHDFMNDLMQTGQEDRHAKINDKKAVERRRSLAAVQARRSTLRKSNISTPCCFQHITSIRPADRMSDEFRQTANGSVSTRRSSTSMPPCDIKSVAEEDESPPLSVVRL